MTFEAGQLINNLKIALQGELPGQDAQYKMAPEHRARLPLHLDDANEYRLSAVMILLCQQAGGGYFVPLIERMAYEGPHSAQISLPGGKYELNDSDLWHTALRECEEEIGIGQINLLGKLTPLVIPVSSFKVHPFIGVCEVTDPPMLPHLREVRSILKLGLEELMSGNLDGSGLIQVQNFQVKTPWLALGQKKVWGATAMILSEFREVLRAVS